MSERRPGRRQRTAETWNAHLILRQDHLTRLEALAEESGATLSELARRALDRGLPLLARKGEDHA